MHLYSNATDFIVSKIALKNIPSEFRSIDEGSRIYGYCFVNNQHIKNEFVTAPSARFIHENNVDVSGIYCCVSQSENGLKLCFDPMLQYNFFIYDVEDTFVASSSLVALLSVLGTEKLSFNKDYLFDQFAYQSPMRGSTLFNEVSLLTYDELKLSKFGTSVDLQITKPNYAKYSNLSYDNLLGIYIERLNHRASVISSKFEEVHIQLTGGADSRLVLSAFQKFENTCAYVYGDGKSQNRLIFEELTNARGINKVDEIKLVGKPLSSPKLICQGLIESNFLKFNNLNTYMNASFDGSDSICKVTGYYGANVCGGVVLPPENTSSNPRLNKIAPEFFTYKSYVESFKERNAEKRTAAFSDLFYINNRGKGHYAAHTLADNKNINSVDILYDYINLLLVEKCPYSDKTIDKNAISIDLIHMNDPQLALFPYDSRQIPLYRDFEHIPLINCFSGYNFPNKELDAFKISHPDPKLNYGELFKGFSDFGSVKEMLSLPAFDGMFERYPQFKYLRDTNNIQAMIFLYYCIAVMFVENKTLLSDDF